VSRPHKYAPTVDIKDGGKQVEFIFHVNRKQFADLDPVNGCATEHHLQVKGKSNGSKDKKTDKSQDPPPNQHKKKEKRCSGIL